MPRPSSPVPRAYAGGAAAALLAAAALSACSGGGGGSDAPATARPSVGFDTGSLRTLFDRSVAQGDKLGSQGWRSSGWATSGRTAVRAWCRGGSGACASVQDADGTKAQDVYAVTAELTNDQSKALGVRIDYASSGPDRLSMHYREVSYASQEAPGFVARLLAADPRGGDPVPVEISETPSYQPAYVDASGTRQEISDPISIGSDVAPADQLRTFTESGTSMRNRMIKRLGALDLESRIKLVIRKADDPSVGVCAADGAPKCPPKELTKPERKTALADLATWYDTQRRVIRADADDIVAKINAPVDWAALVAG